MFLKKEKKIKLNIIERQKFNSMINDGGEAHKLYKSKLSPWYLIYLTDCKTDTK